ncbi:5'-nucleotidase / UDP-sugar diphosphatase [Candidatus Planktophila lacus]|uniref:5'-nucleotidase C-terminal domain-containing protein n=1 Tax=Candidatus Planktophila lacus TaxID=1884913 RepID=UPI000BACDFDD|nr:5'-nucleotidase C-terminal domain-containing protein [Candidatus Planktophila lacus]ASY25669.1 5'-nucleotidase / UDP-sugar diphosphatase [Candidatus Planktophila lacus]ASY29633.1 5'-nucleotidase / UDP-sugar diphosphatase [Candidatus Planktophila lacus]
MNIKFSKILGLGSIALATSLLVSLLVPTAQAATYSLPNAPTSVTSKFGSTGIVVRWTPADDVTPAVTGYVVSAGAGSCPVFVPAKKRGNIVLMPVVVGQPAGTPVVQAVNAYGFSKPTASTTSYTAAQLAKVASSSNKNVQLLQLSDLHGAIEVGNSFGTALLASNWDADRKASAATVALSSGDNIGAAPPISTEFEEMSTIESLNLIKLDVSAFGNHEHDRNLEHVQKVIGASTFQWVTANYGDESLKVLKSGTKEAKAYTIIERGGVKIGVVGANTPETIEQVFPGNLDYKDSAGAKKTIQIEPGVAGINKAVAEARAAGAEVVAVLIHQGWTENSDGVAKGLYNNLAAEIKGADAIYGGHSHQTFSTLIPSTARNATPVLLGQTRNAGVEYTRSQICLKAGKVVGSSLQHVLKAAAPTINTGVVSTVTTQDTAGAALVKKYKDQLTGKLDVKIGQVSAVFPRGGTPAVERSGENPMGNYIADLLRAKYKTDIAITNGGGIRDTFPAKTYIPANTALVRTGSGPLDVTLGDALTVYPFGNQVATTVVTGTNLWKALENGVGGNYPADGRFPQVSGIKFSFDSSKPVGSRIVEVTKLDGTAIAKDSKEYTLTTLDFIIYGGDGYLEVFSPAKAKVYGALLDVFVDALKADMAAGKVTQLPVLDGRVKKVG